MNSFSTLCDALCSQGFYCIDNFLAASDYQSLAAIAKNRHGSGLFRSAKIGRDLNAKENQTIRNDKIAWIDQVNDSSAIHAYFSQTQKIADHLNQTLFLGLSDFESHFAMYPPGSFYRKHIDQFSSTNDRRISCVYYLNEQWQESDGGHLKLYNEQDNLMLTLSPLGNRFICFKSDLVHEVCETNRIRYSIAGWMKVRAIQESTPTY